ncbi:protein PAT1 homolog 2-like, partial [Heptranchias perlo]|uniref:protein PAT1 homolog 2-like n=1 Tax=Heptranchias perlo TaxID=212740 RepID=UPI00355A23E3
MERAAEPEDFLFLDDDVCLQEMAEDEDIDLYNEETFGLDIETAGDLTDELYLLCEALETRSPERDLSSISGDEVPPDSETETEHEPAAEAVEKSQPGPVEPAERADQARAGAVREKREWKLLDEAVGRLNDSLAAQELEDPAVMKACHGKPTLESLDSAIVDSEICTSWGGLSISQVLDRAVQRVMEKTAMFDLRRAPLGFVPSHVPRGYPQSPAMKRPSLGQPAMSPCHRLLQMPPGRVPPIPFRPMSPSIAGSKMMQMRFGSPTPNTSFYSPSASLLETFRFPGYVTQLHPQHRRLLKQRQQQMRSPSKKECEERPESYASLMTKEEKAWVIKLQMMQLQSENPHLDDYYYQEFFRKLELKLTDEELGERTKREPQNWSPLTYRRRGATRLWFTSRGPWDRWPSRPATAPGEPSMPFMLRLWRWFVARLRWTRPVSRGRRSCPGGL